MNLAALQQRDPYISEIIDTASQVALYSFNAKTNEWEKTSIEGSLFIYKRSATPLRGFMILNRLGLNNLIEPIAKDLEFQLQDPFLLYRNAKTKSIYGIWFYDKDECRKLGELMNRYLQDILEEHGAKPQGARPGSGGNGITHGNGVGIKGKIPVSGVDIMQMLSKAQQEYDTTQSSTGQEVRKTEPKPMIDNPNAAATKVNNIIRPMPLKMPDSEQSMTGQDDPNTGTTPGTAPISLDALFRTASLQQQGTTNLPANKPPLVQRSVSMTATSNTKVTEQIKHTESDEYPPLLKHIMSSSSMVTDIEKHQIQPPANHPSAIDTVLPDLTQPPPNHPAYRGQSPNLPKPLPKDNVSKVAPAEGGPFSVQGYPPQMISGNLAHQSPSQLDNKPPRTHTQSLSSEPKLGDRISPKGDADTRRISPNRDVRKDMISKGPSPVSTKASSLLTPGELLQSAGSGGAAGYTALMDKPQNPSFASAAASLSTELLSPMAFLSTTATTRKTPPVQSTQEKPEGRARDSDDLPVAALTKEQLQQALLHLIKNDPSFITTLHEAYLASLHELSGSQKS